MVKSIEKNGPIKADFDEICTKQRNVRIKFYSVTERLCAMRSHHFCFHLYIQFLEVHMGIGASD
jgi:hypothetical protein